MTTSMSYRKRNIPKDVTNNTANSSPLLKRQRKSNDNNGGFESQNIWKNLERIRASMFDADKAIKNSCLFVPILANSRSQACVNLLHDYISSDKLKLVRVGKRTASSAPAYIALKNFSVLDCCLALTALFAVKDKSWVRQYNEEVLTISETVRIGGSVYFPKNTLWKTHNNVLSDPNFYISKSTMSSISEFQEYHLQLSTNESMTYFINGIGNFIVSLKFGKLKKDMDKSFSLALNSYNNSINLSIYETLLGPDALLDMKTVTTQNSPLIERSKKFMESYIHSLVHGETQPGKMQPVMQNNSVKETPRETPIVTQRYRSNVLHTSRMQTVRTTQPVNQGSPNNETHNAHYRRPEEVKSYCLTTLRASMDLVKKKQAQQIFKAYITCPKQGYLDKLTEKLEDIQSKTSCNVVVLHLNNIHESEPWFDSLKINRSATASPPPPSTMKIISVGGVGEYINRALKMIEKILDS
ncbi:Snu56p KNAG_0A04170 [Huiozyma naganishii CBS 8797]|uniref:Uncharacterized protein n=1 Tax=Huiozyma naganishii (strain ATCC MYA-139 / BCRC 22969 / CBS 8797 / KCTC 17520 / NBRC 10181 / NCYC 3082 / Yp74L-3) TaxID=1071383 RepID=J7QZY5_HUIN7|nr:hypothetical protein KNAG_0A04170 [Kazachstania naganishii CBS 8797]CCK68095.1 hypothetical protein KNAG_0A04170 [Kazachstania naganishii CBS 8797]